MILDKQYWDNRYASGQTGWDLKQISPPLKAYIDKISNKELSILIPGCGYAYEANYLLELGFTNVTLIDIAPLPIKKLQEELKNDKRIRILNADFFEHNQTYDLILEQTFFCALPKNMRTQYASAIYKLLKPGGKLAGLLFASEFESEGPPFGGTSIEYNELFGFYFKKLKLELCYNSIPPRADNELFIIAEKES